MKYTKYYPYLFAVIFFIAGCKDEKTIDCDVFEWGYEENNGPEEWAECIPACGGQSQSPINITGAVSDTSLAPLNLNYENSAINIIHNGHTVQFQYAPGSTLTFEGNVYELKQFHFHTPSEHTLSSQSYPLEVHLVNQDAAGNSVAIGIVFEIGNENPFLEQFIDSLPEQKDEVHISATEVNVIDLFPSDKSYYHYGGSLTAPPCTEPLLWFVMKNPIELSAAQLEKFVFIFHINLVSR